jgi:hypothetical protein
MPQHSSIEALQQQLIQLEKLTEEQLNELLQRLEIQKTRLPLEDHPIIDWGIGVIRAKTQEEEQWRLGMYENLDRQYKNYESFIEKLGWNLLSLRSKQARDELYSSGWKELDGLVRLSYLNSDNRILQYAETFTDYLSRFCREQRVEGYLFSSLIQAYIEVCNQYTKNVDFGQYFVTLQECLIQYYDKWLQNSNMYP